MVRKFTAILNRRIKLFKATKQAAGLLFFITLFFYTAAAQAFVKVTNFPNVYNLAIDKTGYVWLANQSGLRRYDGQNIVNVFDYIDNPPFKWILEVIADGDILYLATENQGIWQYHTQSGQLNQLTFLSQDIQQITGLTKIGDVLYFHSKNSFHYYDLANQQLYSHQDYSRYYHLVNYQNSAYVATNRGLEKFNLQAQKFELIVEGTINHLSASKFGIVYTQGKGARQLCHYQQQHFCRSNNYQIDRLLLSGQKNVIWLITSSGQFLQLNAQTLLAESVIEKFRSDFNYSFFEDVNGHLWLTTNRGIFQYNFSNFDSVEINYQSPIQYNYLELVASEDHIWVGTNGAGLYKITTDSSTAEPVLANAQLVNDDQRSISDIVSYQDWLFMTTWDGVYALAEDESSLIRLDVPHSDELFLSANIIDDVLYAMTDGAGVARYQLVDKKWLAPINQQAYQLPSDEVLNITQDNLNQFWISTAEGVAQFDADFNFIQQLALPKLVKYSALISSHNKLYIGSVGNGLFIVNLAGDVINHILPSMVIFDIKMALGKLWLSTNNGLYQLDAMDDTATLVQGTESWEVTDEVSIYHDYLVVPTLQGIKKLPIASQQASDPSVVVTEVISSKGREINTNEVKLTASEELVTLNLAVLDYRNTSHHKFRYRINQSDWQSFRGNSLSLTGLKSGEHFIEIQGTDSLGFWSNKDAYFKISVKPKWYWNDFSRFVYAALVMLLAGCIVWLISIKAQTAKRAKALLQGELLLKQRTYSIVKLNLRKIYKLAQKKDDLSVLADITALSEDALQHIALKNHHSGRESLGSRSLDTALPILVDYLCEQFNCQIIFNAELPEISQLNYELQSDIYRAFYELANLSIYEANSSELELTLRLYNQKIWLICHDNGENFTVLQKHIGVAVGIQLLNQIADKYHSRIEFGRRKNQGNAVTLAFKVELQD